MKEQYLQSILSDPELQGIIAKAAGRSVQTVVLWAKQNSQNLQLKRVLIAICDYLGTREEELLEPIKAS